MSGRKMTALLMAAVMVLLGAAGCGSSGQSTGASVSEQASPEQTSSETLSVSSVETASSVETPAGSGKLLSGKTGSSESSSGTGQKNSADKKSSAVFSGKGITSDMGTGDFSGWILKVSKVNSWPDGDRKAVQMGASLENRTGSAQDSWEFRLDIGAEPKVSDSWNCSLKTSGSVFDVTPADYNKHVDAGGTVNDIGIIFSTVQDVNIEGTYRVDASTKEAVKMTSEEEKTYRNAQIAAAGAGNTAAAGSGVKKEVAAADKSGTPFANHGKLKVDGIDLVDAHGKAYQLKGVSTHGIAWFPQFVNEDAFRTLRDSWGANLVRLAMYTAESGGYCTDGDRTKLEQTIDTGVKAATDLGMYVIIDWHILSDQTPLKYQDQAKDFFGRMSAKYAGQGNVLYEICNEPNGSASWSDIKAYAEEIIPIIRAHNPDAVIIVGTPTWSQGVDKAAADPIRDYPNIMYTLHFYAATHKDDLRNKLTAARNSGLPIFVSEFSICDASGNGGIDYDSAAAWKSLINQDNLSYAGWSLANKNETSALLKSNVTKTSGWTDDDLSDTGLWLKQMIAGK